MGSPTHEWPNVLRSITESQGLPRTGAVEYDASHETLQTVIGATGMLKRSSQDAAGGEDVEVLFCFFSYFTLHLLVVGWCERS